MYSDNRTAFIGVHRTIMQETGKTIKWKFIPKGVPWQIGFWERMIGIIKKTLKKVIGKAQ